MTELATRYLGLELRNPLVVSPSPLSETLDGVRRIEAAGAGAVVLPSLFEEQLRVEAHDLEENLSRGSESWAEASSYFPEMGSYNQGPEGYLEHLRRCRHAVGIPVIASLNGVTRGGWTGFARSIEEAGASALELNIYDLPTDPGQDGAAVEDRVVALVKDVRAAVGIPLAVKLGPFYSSLPHLAMRLGEAGADGLVLFNRFYQPDLDVENLEVVPDLHLSTPDELRLRLRWAAILYGRVKPDLAVTGGVHGGRDVLKCLMAGAQVAMLASALLRLGVEYLETVRREMEAWMEEHEYESVGRMRGSMSHRYAADPAAFERANYMKVLRAYALKKVPGR